MLFIPLYTNNSNSHKVNWEGLSGNQNAIYILQKNKKKINWESLSVNPNAIPILEKNLDKVNWESLSKNPNAIHLLFKYDYQNMKQNNKQFCKELVQKVFNP